jgi:hypothetical protein
MSFLVKPFSDSLNLGLALAWQALYHLLYIANPLCFIYFLNREIGSHFIPQASLGYEPTSYASHHS